VTDRITVGMVGLGGWGKNLLRNFGTLPEADLRWCCDADEATRERYAAAYPNARFTATYDELLADPGLRAVVLATPVPTHFELARRAILAGKDVMVEKPMTWTAAEAYELRDLVSGSGRVLMVGHLLRFHPGVDKLRELVESGHLGDVHYVYGNRLNLGTIRPDENALWSLGVHDISVVLHLLEGDPVEVWAIAAQLHKASMARQTITRTVVTAISLQLEYFDFVIGCLRNTRKANFGANQTV